MCRAKDDPTCPGGRLCPSNGGPGRSPAQRAARRTRDRAAYAAKKGTAVRTPKSSAPTRVAHASVVVEGGWVREVSADPRALEIRERAETEIGPEHRSRDGRIRWYELPPEQRAWRKIVDGPAPKTVRISEGLVDADGAVVAEKFAALSAEKRLALTDLLKRSFAS